MSNQLKHETLGIVGSINEPKNVEVNDLKSLIELGCVRDSVKIADKVFCLRSLNSMERLILHNFLGKDPNSDKLFEFNIKLLATAIETVDGKPLENFHPDISKEPDKAREEILSSMQNSVISKLLDFYTEISERSDSKFDVEQVKK